MQTLYLPNVILGQNGSSILGTLLSAMPNSIGHVLCMRSPSQIARSIIQAVAVKVTCLGPKRLRTMKCRGYERMNKHDLSVNDDLKIIVRTGGLSGFIPFHLTQRIVRRPRRRDLYVDAPVIACEVTTRVAWDRQHLDHGGHYNVMKGERL